MKIDLNHALIYYFKDNKLLIKIIPIYIIFFAQIFIPVIAFKFLPYAFNYIKLILLITLALLPFVFGYITLNTNSRIFCPKNNSLNNWKNFKEIYKIGILSTVFSIVPVFIILGISLIVAIISNMLTAHIVAPSFQFFETLDKMMLQQMLFYLPILIVIYFVLSLPLYLRFTANFGILKNESKKQQLTLKDIYTKDYLNVAWYHFLFSVLLLAITIPTNYMVAIVLAPFIILILTDINAQFVRQVFDVNNTGY